MAQRISPKEAFDLMAQGYTYVDVRSTPEFEAGHPAGAVHIPVAEASPTGMQPNPNFVEQFASRFAKDAKVIVGCQAGGRSARAAMMLEQNGFTNLVDQRAGRRVAQTRDRAHFQPVRHLRGHDRAGAKRISALHWQRMVKDVQYAGHCG